jgi:hypothetical protein
MTEVVDNQATEVPDVLPKRINIVLSETPKLLPESVTRAPPVIGELHAAREVMTGESKLKALKRVP